MNKIGDFLTLIKEVEFSGSYHPTYTLNKRYQIIDINDKRAYYITNDSISDYMKQFENETEKEKKKRLKQECTIWTEQMVNEYFKNIVEERKEKIKKIKSKFAC